MKKKLLLTAAIVVIVALGALVIATPKIEPEPPLPNPNGYDDFLKATTLLSVNPPDWQSMSGEEQHEALKKLIATNQVAIDQVRIGLTKECRVVPYELNATNSIHLTDLGKTKAVAQTFLAASKLALIEGRTNEAAILAIDCIRYGNETTRGGVLIDGLVGFAIKSIGLASLKSATDGMDLENSRKALSALDEIANRSESSNDIMKRERQWARRGKFGPAGIISQLVQPFLNRKALEKSRQRFIKIETDIQRMQIQVAAHAYELEHGQAPAAARDLIPQYLKAVPLDPETGKELPLN